MNGLNLGLGIELPLGGSTFSTTSTPSLNFYYQDFRVESGNSSYEDIKTTAYGAQISQTLNLNLPIGDALIQPYIGGNVGYLFRQDKNTVTDLRLSSNQETIKEYKYRFLHYSALGGVNFFFTETFGVQLQFEKQVMTEKYREVDSTEEYVDLTLYNDVLSAGINIRF
jgi:hypothetical protein